VFHIAKKFLKHPVEVSAEPHVDPQKLSQIYYDIDDPLKFSLLLHLLKHEESKKVIIFCNTRNNVDFVANNLERNNIPVMAIHGGFSQDKRNRIIEEFHHKKSSVLIATDVAARGLDIRDISHVYNYDIPPNKKEYVHRIGRTARAGKEGKVINIIASRDHENFQQIMMHNEFNIQREEAPYIERVQIHRAQQRGRFQGRGFSRGGFSHRRPSFRGERRDHHRGRGDSRHREGRERSRDHSRGSSHRRDSHDRRDSRRDSRRNTHKRFHSFF
jgi:ATP-dependent RNA helicase DeaD